MKKRKMEEPVMSREEWILLIPHESVAEIPEVPTWKAVVDWCYEHAIRK